MRLHEITNKKERLDEIAPALVALAPWLANAARVIGPQIYKWIAKHGTKKVASHLMNKIHLGHKLHAVSDIGKKDCIRCLLFSLREVIRQKVNIYTHFIIFHLRRYQGQTII